MRALVETGVLVGEHGTYRLVKPLQGCKYRLRCRRCWRHASTGYRWRKTSAPDRCRDRQRDALPLLQAVAELLEEVLHCGLDHLQAAEFLYETRLFPEREFTFKHALTHEVAYGSLLQERRRVPACPHCRGARRLRPGPPGRTGGTAGAPCLAGCSVGQGTALLPARPEPGRLPARRTAKP